MNLEHSITAFLGVQSLVLILFASVEGGNQFEDF